MLFDFHLEFEKKLLPLYLKIFFKYYLELLQPFQSNISSNSLTRLF